MKMTLGCQHGISIESIIWKRMKGKNNTGCREKGSGKKADHMILPMPIVYSSQHDTASPDLLLRGPIQ
ncbi:hypothetical protein LIER_42358 [Lithospermum erythrorhizon]|uniref:Uncharacterized protein n=1 Tax=Lithospermum erythrorhizon TaxID=34254 RepID=A0AAV3RNG8_LITER